MEINITKNEFEELIKEYITKKLGEEIDIKKIIIKERGWTPGIYTYSNVTDFKIEFKNI